MWLLRPGTTVIDWEAHLDRLEDAIDRASIAAERAERQRLGDAEYRRLCTTLDEAERITSGTSALAVWRERARLTQRALAEAAGVSPSYLAEIESGKKPGSALALLRIAQVLRVPVDYLIEQGRM